jgi:transcriptional regulator with XRE-family HTH domain
MPMKGAELRAIRDRMNLTQRALAERLGVHPNSVARMERSELRISAPVAKLARLLATHHTSRKERKT